MADFNFEWIFAIVAGGAILFLAIYGALSIGDGIRIQKDTEIAKKISILTDPLQAGFASGSMGKIIFSQETRINNVCYSENFGRNDISVSTRSGVGKEWRPQSAAVSIPSKYIFSENQEAKEFSVFSKPFKFPYEVSDLIFMTSKTYCFKDVPQNVEDDLEAFNSENIRIENCSQEDTEVCFSGSCDIMVNCDCEYDEYTGFVQKNNKKMYFAGNLLFAAIFSDKEIYDCNVERLFYRASKVAEVFSKKADLMNSRNCGTNLQADLLAWSAMLKKAKAEDIGSLFDASKNLGEKNEIELCSIW